MGYLILSLIWMCIIAALLFRSCRQFLAYKVIDPNAAIKSDKSWPAVAVIVPARNEAASIGACVRSLASQEYPAGRLTITVVDDDSSDGTADVVRGISGYGDTIRIVDAGRLPAGWTGKPHACFRGFMQSSSEWLCFMDADTVAFPSAISTAVAFAEEKGIHMLSLEPFQRLVSFWERLVIPAGLLLISFITDLRAINSDESPDAAAIGQFILIRRSVYEQTGGHAAVRAEIIEDTALARVVKKEGYRVGIAGGNHLLSVRLYSGLSQLWEGLSKNAIDIVGGRVNAIVIATGGVLLGWLSVVMPFLAFGATGNDAAGIAAFSVTIFVLVVLMATAIAEARYFRIPLWYGLLFPLGFTLVALITFNSAWAHTTGRVRWKGRIYVPPGQQEHGAQEVKEEARPEDA